MKNTQKFVLVIGITYVFIGIMGSIPAFVIQPSSLPSYVEALGGVSGYGYLFGLFPVNAIHIITGLIGIITSISLDSSHLFSGQLDIYYSLLSIYG